MSPASASLRPTCPFNLTDLTVNIPDKSSSSSRPQPTPEHSPKSRWTTKEFYLYYAVFALTVPWMWTTGVRVSSQNHPLYWQYQHKLKRGWIFGWNVDTSDPQYNLFRSFLPLTLVLALLHLTLSHAFRRLFNPTRSARARFSATFSILLLVALHGSSVLKILAIMGGNWWIVKKGCGMGGTRGGPTAGSRWRTEWTPYAIWAYNIGVLFLNEVSAGWKFGALHPSLTFLDSYPGLLPRWHISWNISMLRLVSWGMEHYWACCAASTFSTASSLRSSPTNLCDFRLLASKVQSAPRTVSSTATLNPSTDYSISMYLAYVLYPPLYLAGPIMSYPSFVSQLASSSSSSSSSRSTSTPDSPSTSDSLPQSPHSETSPPALLSYTVRFLFSLLTMELLLHSMYPVAIKDATRGPQNGEGWWMLLSPAEVGMVGFWNLIVVWLKLLLPWRLFRLWALLDGVNPPENMVRCMANNYSTGGFWRSWHRSYNLWVIRYLYIPLGGSSRPLLATLGVFTFVALWHDLQLRLLVWGWGITLFIVPEMVCKKVVSYDKYGSRPWYRPLAALGGVANILFMMTANLVGFVLGFEGAREVWARVVGGWEGQSFLVIACACLFVAVQVMFEYREEERRRGINRKC
ncbi:hypothetical protein JCM11641_006751 [Rhodosporidiobolus odoratus]